MNGSVLVIGAGIAGMRAASELLEQGFKVYLLEEKPTIGGKMAQIDKMFPYNECATCTELPQMLALTSNPNLNLIAFSSLNSVEGQAGDFTAKIVKKPRYVNFAKCTACTDCFATCPVCGVPMEFNLGRGASKAISFYSPFPPRKALINPEKCIFLTEGSCGEEDDPPCVTACKQDAIDFSQKPEEITIKVGAIIIATGTEEEKGEALAKYGYGKLENVCTALEYERLLSGLGPTLGLVKRIDGKEPKSIAWLVLDEKTPVGFMSAAAEAMGTIERDSGASVSVLYQEDVEMEHSYKDFCLKAKEAGVKFIKAATGEIYQGQDGSVVVNYGDGETTEVDMLVLSVPQVPSKGTEELAKKLGVEWDNETLFTKDLDNGNPVLTSKDGIFVCGDASGVDGISSAIVQSCAAAANADALLQSARNTQTLMPQKREMLNISTEDEPSVAVVICRCGMNIAGLLDMEELVEYVETLPSVVQVEVTPFGCDGNKIKELIGTGKFNRVLIGACSPKTHESLLQQYAEVSGLNKYLVEIVNLRNQCTWVHSKDKEAATKKAKVLMEMGVRRVCLQVPLENLEIPVSKRCFIIGATMAGLSCAAKLAEAGFDVCVADNRRESDIEEIVKPLLAKCLSSGKIKMLWSAEVEKASGFVGNYEISVSSGGALEDLKACCIVIATKEKISAKGTDYQNELSLKQDDRGFFIGALGILNPLDFSTEGIFMCGDVRKEISSAEGLALDGEAAASRVMGIIGKEKMIKAPTVSYVLDKNCDGCAYCIDPCPARAIKLVEYVYEDRVKKTAEVNQAMCKGCGICMATCPKSAIFINHFESDQFRAMTKAVLEVE